MGSGSGPAALRHSSRSANTREFPKSCRPLKGWQGGRNEVFAVYPLFGSCSQKADVN